MNKDQRLIYLFTRTWGKKKEAIHDWKMTYCDPLKYYVEYTCRCCGEPMAEYVYDIADTKGIIQLLNHKAPKCKSL